MNRLSKPCRLLLRTVCLVLAVLLGLGQATAAAAPGGSEATAVQGTLDLSGWSFPDRDILLLNGEWEFYLNKLLEPSVEPEEIGQPRSYAAVPRAWGSGNPAAPSGEAYGTYRLRIVLSPEQEGALKALYIRNTASAYRIYVNGVHLGGNGRVGTARAEMEPKNYAKMYTFPVHAGSNEVLIQVSNYVQRKGGLWSPILFGEPEAIADKKDSNVAVQLFISSALLMLGLYHMAVCVLRKRDKLSLLTGGACLLICIRSLLLGDTLLVRLFPGVPWEWAVKFEYWGVYLSLSLFAAFVRLLFPKETNRTVLRVLHTVNLAVSASLLLLPARVYTHWIWYLEGLLVGAALYLFCATLLAVKRKRVGARLISVAGLLILVTVIHDILYYSDYIEGVDLAPFGVLAFFFTQTLVVALKFSKAYEDVEHLSGELSEVNHKLEEKIQERTKALEVSNSYLVYANEHLNRVENSRRELIANITHELGTPMTSIQGYMKAFLDGVVQPEKQYIQIIYDKIQLAERLVQDLFDLTKLEEGQTSFHMVDVIVEELFGEQFSMFRWDVENAGLSFRMDKPECSPDRLAVIRIDPIRIRQVLINLIGNALNYTGVGGSVTLTGSYSGDRLIIAVADTGRGIDPAVLPHIFDRFVKDSGPRLNAKGGSGLGLAIAKEIVLHHGGNMTVRSEPGKGSTFSFDLPVEFIPMVVD